MLVQSSIQLAENKERVNSLNVFPVPDGDTGTNMYLTITQAIENISALDKPSITELVKAMSKGCLMGARGNSGVILSQIFRGFASSLEGKDKITLNDFASAMRMSQATAYKAVLKPVEGTMLTVIKDMADSAMQLASSTESMEVFMKGVMESGKKSLRNTPNLLKPLKDAGVVDSGGMGVLFIFNGFLIALGSDGVDLSEFKSPLDLNGQQIAQNTIDTESIEYSYCTEFIIRGENLEDCNLRPFVMSMGDSVVYVNDEDILKVHVHTNDPGLLLTEALKHGEIVKTKIENMKEQHSELVEGVHAMIGGENSYATPAGVSEENLADVGFVAVCSGKGIADILKSLGVNTLIEGGQTMNPSTKDIHQAIISCAAKEVYVFPNNSNIVLAARQAAEISDVRVHVVPTKTIPQCIACMLVFNESEDAKTNLEQFEDQISAIKTLQVTHSIRDTVIEGIEISKDSYLAILDGAIVGSNFDVKTVISEALDSAVDEDSELISVYVGENVSDSEAEELEDLLTQKYEDIDVEFNIGKQPVYYYIISVE